MGGLQPAARGHQSAEHLGGDAVGRAGDDVGRTAGKTKICSVGLDHGDGVAEAAAELAGATRVGLDGDDVGAGGEQWLGERSSSCANVEVPGPSRDAGVGDDPFSPVGSERVPPHFGLCRSRKRTVRTNVIMSTSALLVGAGNYVPAELDVPDGCPVTRGASLPPWWS